MKRVVDLLLGRTVRVVVMAAGAAALAIGAGGSAAAFSAVDAATAPPASNEDGPISIEHRHGTLELDAPAERIVSLDLQWTDALLSLGITPLAYLDDPSAGETGQFPWQAGLLEGSEPVVVSETTLPLERIAELDPDLILVGWYGAEADEFDKLAEIAPTIGLLGDNQVDSWRDQLAVAAEVTGRSADQMSDVATDVDDLVAAKRAELPGLEGRTYALVNYVAGEGFYVVADPDDGSSQLFYDLGLEISPTVVAGGDGATGRAEFSLEQIGLLDADMLVFFSQDGDPAELVGYDSLPAVQSGAVVTLDYPSVVGLNTPTPLAVPHSLELISPVLEIVAGD